MSIFDREPTDWYDLQAMVGQLFRELGCEVEISKQVELVRGKKEIDVWVWDSHVIPDSEYLCECKFWDRRVEQEVVHSFRTVVTDYGAHRGFIISKAGFQSGAHEAAENTNVNLVTFAELQALFFDRWRVVMGRRFMPYADALFPYWDPSSLRMPRKGWGENGLDRQRQLIEAYRPFVELGPFAEMHGFTWHFPITLPSVDPTGAVNGKVEITTYRQLYDFLEANKEVALKHFRVLYGEIEG